MIRVTDINPAPQAAKLAAARATLVAIGQPAVESYAGAGVSDRRDRLDMPQVTSGRCPASPWTVLQLAQRVLKGVEIGSMAELPSAILAIYAPVLLESSRRPLLD
jgi:hypothetical protein